MISDRSNRYIFFAVVFFIVGGLITYTILNNTEVPGEEACWARGGVPVLAPEQRSVVCLDPSALR